MEVHEDREVKHLFVIGLPRSGTSLLYKILCSHSQVSLLYESDVYYSWPRVLKKIAQSGWGRKVDNWNGHLSRLEYKDDDFVKFPAGNRISAMKFLYQSQLKDGDEVIGEKSALYSNYLEKLSEDFPDARFVVLWRDLTEVLDSVHRAAKGGDKYFSKRGRDYEYLGDLERLQKGVEALRQKGVQLLEVNYQDLVDERELCCRELCDFMDISYQAEMLTNDAFDASVLPDGQHHSGVKGGQLDAKRGGGVSMQWRNRISRFETRWQRKYKQTHRKITETSNHEPSIYESLICWSFYHLSKIRMHLTVLIYWLMPAKIIKMIRSR